MAVVGDGQALAQRVGFFRVVCGKRDGFARVAVIADDLAAPW